MNKKELYNQVMDYFQEAMPNAETELHYGSVFQLLVAVMLSAQCTDKRVNMITPRLFEAFPTAEAMAKATEEEVLDYIRSISYPNSKAKHLVETAKILKSEYQGEVPNSLEQLIKLPGVGRKTANVVQSVAFGQAAMAVDTHVFRVARRIGLASQKCKTPLAVEKELMKWTPTELVPRAHHWLILHGRYVCQARSPKCDSCGLLGICKRKIDN